MKFLKISQEILVKKKRKLKSISNIVGISFGINTFKN